MGQALFLEIGSEADLPTTTDPGIKIVLVRFPSKKKFLYGTQLVWSNPCPLTNPVAEIRRIMKDEYGSLYVVSYPNGYEEFELTTGRINRKQQSAEQPQSAYRLRRVGRS
jgi:hypothetical protein